MAKKEAISCMLQEIASFFADFCRHKSGVYLSAAKQLLADINKNTCTHYGYDQVCQKTMGIKANQAEEKAANHAADYTGNDVAESTARRFHDSAGNPAGKCAVQNG